MTFAISTPLASSDNDTPSTAQLATAILPCDAYHHFYHYQASAQYLWLAATLSLLEHTHEALEAFDKALFQDHFNSAAIAGKKLVLGGKACEYTSLTYDKNPLYDLDFCTSVGKSANPHTASHDEAVSAFLSGDYRNALALLHHQTTHSNSRFLAGKCHLALQQYDHALLALREAVRLSHHDHDAYHQHASQAHMCRGEALMLKGEIDLAIADFTKALDLYSVNVNARKARIAAYKAKGSVRLAEQDEIIYALHSAPYR